MRGSYEAERVLVMTYKRKRGRIIVVSLSGRGIICLVQCLPVAVPYRYQLHTLPECHATDNVHYKCVLLW